jgi:hypothetical protein
MNTKKTLFYLLTIVLGGCVPVASINCLYTKENAVFDEKLLGTWVDNPNEPETIWEFTRDDEEPNNVYRLVFADEEGNKGSFVTVMVKLKDTLFLDMCPSGLPWDEDADPNQIELPYNAFFVIPAHTFIKVDSIEPLLKLRITMDDKMEELLKENPDAIEHVLIEDRIVLTAKTKQLQEFVLKYADDERLFTEEVVLGRKVVSK